MAKKWNAIRAWTYRYFWRFKTGKIGTALLVVVFLLDLQSRIDILAKWINVATAPATAVILQSGWAHSVLLAIAIILLVVSTQQGKNLPLPLTPNDRLTALEKTVQLLQERWDTTQVETSLSELNQRVALLAANAEESGPLYVWLNDIGTLIIQADQAYGMFDALQTRYPNSDVAKHPFSGGWRPLTGREPADEPTRLGLEWAWRMKHHGQALQEFSRVHRTTFAEASTGKLLTHITSWQSHDVTARECLELLSSHKSDLNTLRLAKSSETRSRIEEQTRYIDEPKQRINPSEPQTNDLSSIKAGSNVKGTLTVDKKPFQWGRSQTFFKWDEGLSLQIDCHESGTCGLVLSFINDTPDYLPFYQVEVTEANSWNESHQTFLPNRAFNRRQIISGRNFEPIHKTNGQWLVRVLNQNNDTHLAIGNDDSNKLSWPNNDPTTVEIWRLTIAVSYEPRASTPGNVKGLPAKYLLVRWDRTDGTIQMLKRDNPDVKHDN